MVIVLISNAQFKRAGLQVKQNRWSAFAFPSVPNPCSIMAVLNQRFCRAPLLNRKS